MMKGLPFSSNARDMVVFVLSINLMMIEKLEARQWTHFYKAAAPGIERNLEILASFCSEIASDTYLLFKRRNLIIQCPDLNC